MFHTPAHKFVAKKEKVMQQKYCIRCSQAVGDYPEVVDNGGVISYYHSKCFRKEYPLPPQKPPAIVARFKVRGKL